MYSIDIQAKKLKQKHLKGFNLCVTVAGTEHFVEVKKEDFIRQFKDTGDMLTIDFNEERKEAYIVAVY